MTMMAIREISVKFASCWTRIVREILGFSASHIHAHIVGHACAHCSAYHLVAYVSSCSMHNLCMMNPELSRYLWSMNHRHVAMCFSEGLPKAVSHAHQLHWRQSGGDDPGDVPYATAHG